MLRVWIPGMGWYLWYQRGKYHCTIGLLFDWFRISCKTTDNFCFYLQNRLIQTIQTGGEQYRDTSPFSIHCFKARPCKTPTYLSQLSFVILPLGRLLQRLKYWALVANNLSKKNFWKQKIEKILNLENLKWRRQVVLTDLGRKKTRWAKIIWLKPLFYQKVKKIF